MDLFVVILYLLCDDHFYGYNEYLRKIYPTFEEAKKYVDSYLLKSKEYDGKSGNPFVEIVGMKWGETNKETLFSSKSDE